MVILAIGIIAIAGLFPASSGVISQAGRETTAAQLAQEQIERIRRATWTSPAMAVTWPGAACPQFNPGNPPAAFGTAPVRVFSEGVDRNYTIWSCVATPFAAASPPNTFIREITIAVVYRNVGREIVDTFSAYRAQTVQ